MSDLHAPLSTGPQYAQPGQYAQPPPSYGQPQAYPPSAYQQQPGAHQYAQQYAQQHPYVVSPGQPQAYVQTTTHVVPVYQTHVGPCAAGGPHNIREEFTACGLVCGILLFPIGLICCLTMKDRTCMSCGMKFD